MNARLPRKSSLITVLVVVPFVLLNPAFANKCCQNVSGCTGCLQVSSAPPRYVKVNSNVVKKCVSNTVATTCSEGQAVCFSGTGVNVYEAGCANMVGTISVNMETAQCGSNDDWCNSGG